MLGASKRNRRILVMEHLTINYFLIFIVSTVAISPMFEKIEKLNLRCDVNNSKYWELIEWYFERTPYVTATTITDSHRDHRDTSTIFLMQLTKCIC